MVSVFSAPLGLVVHVHATVYGFMGLFTLREGGHRILTGCYFHAPLVFGIQRQSTVAFGRVPTFFMSRWTPDPVADSRLLSAHRSRLGAVSAGTRPP